MASDVSELRLAMQAAGFDPVPVIGKDARLKGWNTKHSAEEVAAWAVRYPRWSNTGMRTCDTPTLDVDILHPEAAAAVEEMIKGWFNGRGPILVRFGLAPKRAIPFRTSTPFPKMTARFVAPDGSNHKIEILGDGQQVVVDGIHPDTGKPYTWHGGRPGTVAWADLPEITEREAAEFLAFATAMLCERYEFKRDEERSRGNGHAAPFPADGAQHRPLVDVEAELAAIHDGASANDAHIRVIPSLLRQAMHPNDVLERVVDVTLKMAEQHKLGWTRDAENRYVRKRILSAYQNLLLRDYDPAWGIIPDWLPGDFHEPWAAALAAGRRPDIGYNRGGFYVRSWVTKADTVPACTAPATTKTADSSLNTAKAHGWNYYDSTQTTPPRWLVKGLLPESGVGILAGQWGSFKTTAALDLAISVMTGQAFAGQYRVKRKGAVLYFAVEGTGTLKARLEAIARHRGAPGNLPFAWRGECPVLTAKGAGQAIIKCVDEAATHFEHAYGVPITLIWIDTYVTAAGLGSSGDDNDVAATQKAFTALRFVAASTGAFVAVVDHYGKILEAGTRGSSSKEGSADTVIATLADRELTGAVSNTRMAARKQRDGICGFEVPFTPEKVDLGLDEDGDPITAIVLDWGKQQDERPKTGRKSKAARLLGRVLAATVAKSGFPFQPDPGGPSVQAVHGKDLLAAFEEHYHAEGTPKQKRDKRRTAYRRALKNAVAAGLIRVRDLASGEEIMWAR